MSGGGERYCDSLPSKLKYYLHVSSKSMIAFQSIMDDGLSQEEKERLNSGGNYLEATHDLW